MGHKLLLSIKAYGQMVGEDPAPGSLTVVTSDARLAERAQALGARVRSAVSFRRRLDEVAG